MTDFCSDHTQLVVNREVYMCLKKKKKTKKPVDKAKNTFYIEKNWTRIFF